MKFSEAMALLEQGKKIRRECWGKDVYYHYFNGDFLDHTKADALVAPDEMMATDWEEYIEPKKKRIVKMWPCIIKVDSESYYLTKSLYKSAEDAESNNTSYFRLATEYPAIEIETDEIE